MKKWLLFFGLIYSGLLVGCSSGPGNVKMNPSFWNTPHQKIIIATATLPTPSLYMKGDQGLIDVLASDIATSDLSKHLEHMNIASINDLTNVFADRLKTAHMQVTIDPTAIDLSKLETSSDSPDIVSEYEFTPIRSQFGDANFLLILWIKQVGAIRSYYGFIPVGSPKPYLLMVGEFVDLNNDHVLWRHIANVIQDTQGDWDQSPNYPNLTNTFFKTVVPTAQQEMVDSFFSEANF